MKINEKYAGSRQEGDEESRWRGRGASEDRRDAGALSRHGRAPPRAHPAECAGAQTDRCGYAKDGKVVCFFRADKYMTFGLTDKANLTREEGAPHQLFESAWYFNTLDDATEGKLSAIVRRAAS